MFTKRKKNIFVTQPQTNNDLAVIRHWRIRKTTPNSSQPDLQRLSICLSRTKLQLNKTLSQQSPNKALLMISTPLCYPPAIKQNKTSI